MFSTSKRLEALEVAVRTLMLTVDELPNNLRVRGPDLAHVMRTVDDILAGQKQIWEKLNEKPKEPATSIIAPSQTAVPDRLADLQTKYNKQQQEVNAVIAALEEHKRVTKNIHGTFEAALRSTDGRLTKHLSEGAANMAVRVANLEARVKVLEDNATFKIANVTKRLNDLEALQDKMISQAIAKIMGVISVSLAKEKESNADK